MPVPAIVLHCERSLQESNEYSKQTKIADNFHREWSLREMRTIHKSYTKLRINEMLCSQDVLRNQDLDLDNMFIASLVADLIKV